jgi:hypothetical protein
MYMWGSLARGVYISETGYQNYLMVNCERFQE